MSTSNSAIFKNEIYPSVKPTIKLRERELVTHIKKYIDKNNSILFDNTLTNRLIFSDYDSAVVLFTVGMNPKELDKKIKETKLTKSSWVLFNKPINWSFMLLLKYYHDTKQTNEFKMVLMYFVLSFYSSLHYRQFPYPPNEEVMRYTTNNLNNKYDIKRLGNLFNTLMKIATNSHDKYKNLLDSYEDLDIINYMANLRTRLSNFVKAYAKEYYQNLKDKKYLNYESDSDDPDNYKEVDNSSNMVAKLAAKTTNNIMREGVDNRIVQLCSRVTKDVGVSAIRDAIENIITNENIEVKELITLILQQYLVVDKLQYEYITSNKFIIYCENLYTKSNTVDKNILRIKQILDEWLNKNSDKYNKTERVATKTNFRKAIYFYFVFSIQSAVNG